MKKNYSYIIYSLLTLLSINQYFFMYLKNNYISYSLLIIAFIFLFIYYKKLDNNIKLDKKYNIFVLIMSFFFVLGYSYEVNHNTSLMFGSVFNFLISFFKILGFYYFFRIVIFYFLKFMNCYFKIDFDFLNVFIKHPFIFSFIFLSLCYGIFLLFYYPGILNYDNANQIKEIMGFHTRYLDAINPIINSTLTNFNPIVHTFLLGGLFKIGYFLNNVNLGLFFYTFIQLLIIITIYSYTISYSINEKTNPLISFIILLVLGFIPLFGFYSITLVKDTLYASFLLLFSLKVYEINKNNNFKINDYLDLFLISILVCLFRNNGIFIILITLPFLFYKSKKIILVLTMVLFSAFCFNRILLPKLKVSGTSIREMLSIPFQQTARLVKLKENKIDNEDKIIINKILDYNNLKIDYNEDLADPVKNKYNKDASRKDLENYAIVWFKYFLKYPNVYLDATINNVTGYFYPFENSWKVYHKLNSKLPQAGFNYHYNNLVKGREILHNYEIFIEASPLGLILNIGFLCWFSILVCLCVLKNKNYIFLIPNLISIAFCFLSPANTYYRYTYPTLVLIVCLFPLIKKLTEKNLNN